MSKNLGPFLQTLPYKKGRLVPFVAIYPKIFTCENFSKHFTFVTGHVRMYENACFLTNFFSYCKIGQRKVCPIFILNTNFFGIFDAFMHNSLYSNIDKYFRIFDI